METVLILTDNTRVVHAQVLLASSAPIEESCNPRESASSVSAATAACCRIVARSPWSESSLTRIKESGFVAYRNEDLANWIACLSIWSRDSRRGESPVGAATPGHAMRHLCGRTRRDRAELGKGGRVNTCKRRFEACGIADHAAEVTGGRTGHIGE